MHYLVAAACLVFGQPADDVLPSLVEKVRAKHDVPALAVGIVRDGKSQSAVVGIRKRGTDVAATVADEWHLGSNTKPMTALLIALLVDLGLLDWDTPLEEIFPEHADKWKPDLKKITPAHLLTHVSGLPTNGPILKYLIFRTNDPATEDRAKLIDSLSSVELSFKPGEKYQYSNLGYVVLGAIVDRRGKATWEDQLEKRLFIPLQIKNWGLGPHGKTDGPAHPWPHHTHGKPLAADGITDNAAIMNSAGRVRMSIADYERFLIETLKLARGEKSLLKPATAQKLFTNPYPASPHSLSGWLGFRKDPKAAGLTLAHDGSNMFNYCSALVLPDRNLAICILTNQAGPGATACHELRKELSKP